MKKLNKWFTLVELIVVISIMVILSSTWYYTYVEYISNARDSSRSSDMAKINSSLKLYKLKRNFYPLPWNYFNITNSWFIVAYQWFLNESVHLSTFDWVLPKDPKINVNYSYSTSRNNQEFQIAMSLENSDRNIALLNWDYKTVSKNILPNIILAISTWALINIEISSWSVNWIINRNYFLFNKKKSIPYSFIAPYLPYYDNINLDTKLSSSNLDFWQNNDYNNCSEIYDAWKSISTWSYNEKYQILENNILTNTWCIF